MEENNIPTYFQFAGGAFGSIIAFFVARMQFRSKKNEAKTLQEALTKIKAEQKELRRVLKEERKIRGKVEGHFENLKFAFKVAFNQYEIEFKDQPEQMVMLKTLREIIED